MLCPANISRLLKPVKYGCASLHIRGSLFELLRMLRACVGRDLQVVNAAKLEVRHQTLSKQGIFGLFDVHIAFQLSITGIPYELKQASQNSTCGRVLLLTALVI